MRSTVRLIVGYLAFVAIVCIVAHGVARGDWVTNGATIPDKANNSVPSVCVGSPQLCWLASDANDRRDFLYDLRLHLLNVRNAPVLTGAADTELQNEIPLGADDVVPVGNGSTVQAKGLPSCSGTGQAISYNVITNTFGCGNFEVAGTAAPKVAKYVVTQADGTLTQEQLVPTCTGTNKLTFDGTSLSCAVDQTWTEPLACAATAASRWDGTSWSCVEVGGGVVGPGAPGEGDTTPYAFPGAQGGGSLATGGRAGAVYLVTNLNNSGTGSLRACVEATGARTCIFRVGGTITLTAPIYLTSVNSNLTVAGQTAPGGGIQIYAPNVSGSFIIGLSEGIHDIVWRYTKIRKGFNSSCVGTNCAVIFNFWQGENIALDHNSIFWPQQEFLSIGGETDTGTKNFTVSWNLMAEALETPQATGLFQSGNSPGSGDLRRWANAMVNLDYHHNLIANFSHRAPLSRVASTRWVNNISYNFTGCQVMVSGGVAADVIGNYWKAGPNGAPAIREITAYPTGQAYSPVGSPSLYVTGNVGPNNPNPAADNWSTMVREASYECQTPESALSTSYQRSSALTAYGAAIVPQAVTDAQVDVPAKVGAYRRLGCDGNWVANRDAADDRVVADYVNGTSTCAGSCGNETEAGGLPTLSAGTACTDTDSDGMPDIWETAQGLNPSDANDRNSYKLGWVYTNLERYLAGNSL